MSDKESFSPHEYALACGWDFTCIEATAAKGVSSADAEVLSEEQQGELLAWCRSKVAEAKP